MDEFHDFGSGPEPAHRHINGGGWVAGNAGIDRKRGVEVMTKQEFIDHLNRLGACSEGADWVKAQNGTPEEIWHAFDRGDWVLWLAGNAGIDRNKLVLAACECARKVWDLMPGAGHVTIKTAEAWCRGEATIDEVRRAGAAAAAAADADATDASLAKSADIARKHIEWSAVEAALENGQ